ncbi:TPR repeat region-containing protein [Nocardia otitidiscaviarum]|uniref:TPR repeat region-containing protein n=1 Tax=Nocardia otitidiscaviarum TaxID=1823 RepID=UPI001895A472|nr:hypothetical protein [Nocardia otitidiscaviarum]MBF6181759.1 hypothetical protein [Nocardia otitidiscaviarum]
MTDPITPTVSQVLSWQIKVDATAPLAETIARELRSLADRMNSTIDGLNWSGEGRAGADYRSDREHQQMGTLASEFDDLAAQSRTHHANLDHMVSTAKTAVASLRDNSFNGVNFYKVAEDWTVTDGTDWDTLYAAAGDNQDTISQLDNIKSTRANTAINETIRLQQLARDIGIEDAATADAIGKILDGIEQLAPETSADGLTPSAAEEDGKAIADGTATDEEIARISERLADTGLTPEQLAALERGEEIDVPPATLAYLQAFYGYAGRDGLLQFSDQLARTNTPQATQLRTDLGNGLMVLSNEKVVTRDKDTGSVVNRGGYDKLHSEVRELVGTRAGTGINLPDANTRELPDDYRGGLFGNDREAAYRQDLERFANLLGASEKGYEPGQRFGMELTRQAAHQAILADRTEAGHDVPWSGVSEQTLQDLVNVGARNDDANYALITGNGDPELFGAGTPGQDNDGYHRDSVLTPLLKHEWDDDGKALSEMFTWINEDARITDPGNPVQVADAKQAGEAAYGLAQLLSTTESGLNKENLYQSWLDVPGHDKQSLGELNPVATKALATALAPYTLDMIDADDNLTNTTGFGELNPVEAVRVMSVLNTDSDAATIINSVALAEADRIEGIYADQAARGNPNHLLGTMAGDMRWLVDSGIDAEIADRTQNAQDADTSKQQKYAAAYTAAQIFAAGFGPQAAAGVAVTEFFKNDITAVDGTFINPFPDVKLTADGIDYTNYNPAEIGDNNNRMYAMVQGLVNGGHIEPASLPDAFLNTDGTMKSWVALNAERNSTDYAQIAAINDALKTLPKALADGGVEIEEQFSYTSAATEAPGVLDREVLHPDNGDNQRALESVLKNDSANVGNANRWRYRD